MDAHTAEITIKLYLTEMRDRLDRAVNIARAAQACADAGHVERGIEVALDIEPLVYEVSTFLNAASLINRLGRS